MPWGTGPSSGSAGLEPRSPHPSPGCSPQPPVLCLLDPAFCPWMPPPGSPPSPGRLELGDLGPHLPGLLLAAKSREQAEIWRSFRDLCLAVPEPQIQGGVEQSKRAPEAGDTSGWHLGQQPFPQGQSLGTHSRQYNSCPPEPAESSFHTGTAMGVLPGSP